MSTNQKELQNKILALIVEKENQDKVVLEARRQTRIAQQAFEFIQSRGVAATDPSHTAAVADLQSQTAALNAAVGSTQDISQHLAYNMAQYVAVTPGGTIEQFSQQTPILLLPVRLETCFALNGKGGLELRVRIFPDNFEVDTHEDSLTTAEMSALDRFHALYDNAPNDQIKQQAWRDLAQRFGSARAAWIRQQPKSASNKVDSWESPPKSKVLPDQWIAVTFKNGIPTVRSIGNPIPIELIVGPDPSAGATTRLGAAQVDMGMQWMIDFETDPKYSALAIGMGLKFDLQGDEPQTGIERLIVLGVKASVDLPTSKKLLEDLFNHHHYTDGLGIVPKGTPTHTTATTKSGYTTDDPGCLNSYAIELGPSQYTPVSNPFDMTDANFLSYALGIDPTIFQQVANAKQEQWRESRNMATALFPATVGYSLREMMSLGFPTGSPSPQTDYVERLRYYYASFVCPLGPLPNFRIGTVPYGVLPVCSPQRALAQRPVPVQADLTFTTLLSSAITKWKALGSQAPRVGATTDPDKELTLVIGTESRSLDYSATDLIGPDYTTNLQDFLGYDPKIVLQWRNSEQQMARAFLKSLGLSNLDPLLIHSAFTSNTYPVSAPIVSDNPPSNKPLDPSTNYITWIRNATIQDLWTQSYGTNAVPDSLLYKILRASTLQAYADASLLLLSNDGQIGLPQEPELVNMDPAQKTVAVRDRFNRTITTPTGQVKVADYLNNPNLPPTQATAELRDLLNSLDYLAGISTEDLDLLTSSTLDASSYRLDSWITAIATWKLITTRYWTQNLTGVYLGAFGWAQNLKPPASSSGPQAGAPQPITTDRSEYIHAPSHAHAMTAAILRNFYSSNYDPETGYSAPIDISSTNVRKALQIIDGIREGQSLSSLLGYRFERELEENNLGKYVQAFRDLYPFNTGNTDITSQPKSTALPQNLVDGLQLKNNKDNVPFGSQGLPAKVDQDYSGIAKALDLIVSLFDHISDISTAESVYQFIQGNYGRSASLMDAVATGQHIPELEIVKTPRGGVGLTNRVVLVLNDPSNSSIRISGNWPKPTPRANAEPSLNLWLGKMLGDPTNYQCTVTFGSPSQKVQVSPADLKLSPIDIMYLPLSQGTAQASELEQRIAYYVFNSSLKPSPPITIQFEPAPTGKISFPQMLEYARALRDLLSNSRPLQYNDLSSVLSKTASPGAAQTVPAELQNRESQLFAAISTNMKTLHDDLTGLGVDPTKDTATIQSAIAAAASSPNIDPKALQNLSVDLYKANSLALQGTLPINPRTLTPSDPATLLGQAVRAYLQLDERANTTPDPTNPSSSVDGIVQQIKNLIGKDFPVAPTFDFSSSNDLNSLQTCLGSQSTLLKGDNLAATKWFQQAAHVRDRLQKYATVMLYGESLATGPSLSFQVAQLPYDSTSTWFGMKFADENSAVSGATSFGLITPDGSDLNFSHPVSGVMIDEWNELIPDTVQHTALAFRHDDPPCEAPQTLLLAIPPTFTEANWKLNDLIEILNDTFDLMILRCVDPDQLGVRNQFIPALFFPENLENATVSTPFKIAPEVIVTGSVTS